MLVRLALAPTVEAVVVLTVAGEAAAGLVAAAEEDREDTKSPLPTVSLKPVWGWQ